MASTGPDGRSAGSCHRPGTDTTRAAGQARAPASGRWTDSPAEAGSAESRARWDRRRPSRRPRAQRLRKGRRLSLLGLASRQDPWAVGQGPCARVRVAGPASPRPDQDLPVGPYGLAPFLDTPSLGSSQPSHFQGPGPPDPGEHSPLPAQPWGRPGSLFRKKQGWGIYFFSPFLFLQ